MRRMHALRVLAVWLAALAWGAGARGAELDPVAMMRLLHDLEVAGDRLVQQTRSQLERTRRWEPAGADAELWQALRAFDEASDRLARAYVHDSYPGMQDDVRAVLERARGLEDRLAGEPVGAAAAASWDDVREQLVRLADSQGWDYAAGRFEAGGAGAEEPLEPELAFDSAPHARDYDLGRGQSQPSGFAVREQLAMRFTYSDDLAVGGGLDQIDHLLRAVQARLGERTAVAAAEAPADAAPGGSQLRRDTLEADLTALESAASDAQRLFAITRRAADVMPEVSVLVALGRRVEDALRASESSPALAAAWTPVREKLNTLAVVYDLERISAE
jgi:hypothetical protein